MNVAAALRAAVETWQAVAAARRALRARERKLRWLAARVPRFVVLRGPAKVEKKKEAPKALVVLLAAGLALAAGGGCATLRERAEDYLRPKPVGPVLPVNPAVPENPEGTSAELFYWGPKAHQKPANWRIRWPSHFARALGVGPGSWSVVWPAAGEARRAEFRSFDTDHGARRPSYTMPLEPVPEAPVRVVLHGSDGRALGWFGVEDLKRRQGRLP